MSTRSIIDALDWLTFLSRLTRVEATARWIMEQPDDPRHETATAILKAAGEVRQARSRGWATASAISKLEQLCVQSDAKMVGPLAERGAKVAASARAGHEAVHGTTEEKAARWRTLAEDYRAAVAAGQPKTLAREAVAARHNVCAKTVQRAAKKF